MTKQIAIVVIITAIITVIATSGIPLYTNQLHSSNSPTCKSRHSNITTSGIPLNTFQVCFRTARHVNQAIASMAFALSVVEKHQSLTIQRTQSHFKFVRIMKLKCIQPP